MAKTKTATQPQGIQQGHVPDNAFDNMSVVDIQQWLKGRFQDAWEGYCPGVVDIGGQINWIQAAFHDLPREVRSVISEATVSLLEELPIKTEDWAARDTGLSEKHEPAISLLNFVNTVTRFAPAEDKLKLQNAILPVLDSADLPAHVRQRALMVLGNSKYSAPDEFWIKQREQLPESTVLVFSILAQQNPAGAFEFLAAQPWKVDAPKASGIAYTLAGIEKEHGADIVKQGMQALREAHPKAGKQLTQIERDAEVYAKKSQLG